MTSKVSFNNIYHLLNKYRASNILLVVFSIAAIFATYKTYLSIYMTDSLTGPDPSDVMEWMLVDLMVFLLLSILAARKVFQKWLGKKDSVGGSGLQNKIIIMFCLIAAIPTIVISIFSAYFFNFGIQSWFDNRIQAVLNQSVHVAESYIVEHKIRLKDTAISIVDDVSNIYYEIVHNPQLFNKILDGQVEMRSLNEAIVFQYSTNNVLAKSSLSFALGFSNIPTHLIEKANAGEIVEIKSDPNKIRMLIKLQEHNDVYLVIGRLIDPQIIEHIDKTQGAAKEYWKLKNLITKMQIKFSTIFIIVTVILLFLVIICAVIFAAYIIVPIKNLVIATDSVKKGDLTVRLAEKEDEDELGILSKAFNRMVTQIDKQQKDLIIAQRALAWSDVARRVAHEIKNPLTPIQLASERLKNKYAKEVTNPEDYLKYLNTIIRHTNDINKIVTEFSNFAKLPNPIFERTNIHNLIERIVESHRIVSDQIIFNYFTNDKKLEIMCDITQITQIMTNLIKNAIEALELNKEKIIDITLAHKKNNLSIVIQDNGSGFPIELMDKIADAYITTRNKGTGLGLAIVKKIVEDHAGQLEIANKNGGHVKMSFDLLKLEKKANKS